MIPPLLLLLRMEREGRSRSWYADDPEPSETLKWLD